MPPKRGKRGAGSSGQDPGRGRGRGAGGDGTSQQLRRPGPQQPSAPPTAPQPCAPATRPAAQQGAPPAPPAAPQPSTPATRPAAQQGTAPAPPAAPQPSAPATRPAAQQGAPAARPAVPQVAPPQTVVPFGTGDLRSQLEQIERTIRKGFPARQGYGTQGAVIQLLANHFNIEVPSGEVYHYDVEIASQNMTTAAVPEQRKFRCLSTKINRIVLEELVAKYRADLANCIPAFDGRKNLYTRRPLPFKERTFTVDHKEEENRTTKFFVKIQHAADVNLDALHAVYQRRATVVPQDVLQALDIIVRHGSCIQLTPVGRSIFGKPGPQEDNSLGGGKEVWFGYYTTVRPAQWKPILNVDRSATAFYEPLPVVEYMCKLFCDRGRQLRPEDFRELREHQVHELRKELKGLKVVVKHLPYPRKYRVVNVTREPARKIFFNHETHGRISVADYFRRKYPGYARFPNLPCIQSGTAAKAVHLPLEVCDIVEGQPYRKKLKQNETSEMIKRTAMPPGKRFQSIRQSVRDVVAANRPYLDEFGIKISTDPMQLKGRVLTAPTLVFDGESTLHPREGAWDLRGKRFLRAATIEQWVLLNLSPGVQKHEVDRFIGMLLSGSRELGMTLREPAKVLAMDPNRTSMRDILTGIRSQFPKLDMLVIVLCRDSNYGEIKQISETELCLRTQCILDNSVKRKCNPPLITNLCQKINTKAGGTNNGLLPREKPDIFRRPVIVVGADVSHPAPGDRLRPSIAACVGSLDAIPSRYQATVRVQMEDSRATSRVEIIRDLTSMMVDLLRAFYRATRHKPERIVFYRDGVSEGQFEEVRNREVAAIRLACRQLSPTEQYEPPITFVVVQKRHHTRFMPANERDGVGRCRNVPPGTTVDTVVTHPVDFDFFLCSHFGIQGTSKPSHYYVVWDDSNFTADDLQKLSYYLCHTYARCARSVSIPAPVYYAHLAAFRAKDHIVSKVDISSTSSEASGGSGDALETEQYVQAVRVLQEMQNQMYYI